MAGTLKSARDKGLIPIVTIGVIDTNRVSVPPDLSDPNDTTNLAPGLNFTSDVVIDRLVSSSPALTRRPPVPTSTTPHLAPIFAQVC